MNNSDNSLLKDVIKEMMESDLNYKKSDVKNYGGNLNKIEEIPAKNTKLSESKDNLIIKNKESYKYVISSLNYENKEELKEENYMKEYIETSFDDNKSVKSKRSKRSSFSKDVKSSDKLLVKKRINPDDDKNRKKQFNMNKSSIVNDYKYINSGNKSFLDFLNSKFDVESKYLKSKNEGNKNQNTSTPKKSNDIQFLHEILNKESSWGSTSNRYFKKINTFSKMPDKKIQNKVNNSVILPLLK